MNLSSLFVYIEHNGDESPKDFLTCLTLEDWTDILSRNVASQPTTHPVITPRERRHEIQQTGRLESRITLAVFAVTLRATIPKVKSFFIFITSNAEREINGIKKKETETENQWYFSN